MEPSEAWACPTTRVYEDLVYNSIYNMYTTNIMQHYAITISPSLNPRAQDKEALDKVLQNIAKKAKSFALTEKVYELTSHRYLHMHGTVLMRRSQWLKKLQQKGYSIKIDKLKSPEDIQRWSSYIHKQSGPESHFRFPIQQQRLIDEHRFDNNRIFT